MFPISVRIKLLLPVIILISLTVSFFSYAKPTGEALYQQCVACHGVKGEGLPALNAPAIAGQDTAYLSRQLLNFSSGIRDKSEQAKSMALIAKALTKAEVDELARYLQAMAVTQIDSSNSITGSLRNGARYYQAKCGACHGGQAQGNAVFNAPRLANQNSQYLLQQMRDFVVGDRGYAQGDKYGRQMAMMANTTKGQELTDILFYIAKQSSEHKVK